MAGIVISVWRQLSDPQFFSFPDDRIPSTSVILLWHAFESLYHPRYPPPTHSSALINIPHKEHSTPHWAQHPALSTVPSTEHSSSMGYHLPPFLLRPFPLTQTNDLRYSHSMTDTFGTCNALKCTDDFLRCYPLHVCPHASNGNHVGHGSMELRSVLRFLPNTISGQPLRVDTPVWPIWHPRAKLNLPHPVPLQLIFIWQVKGLYIYPSTNLLILDLAHQVQFHHLHNIELSRTLMTPSKYFPLSYFSFSIAP